MFYLIQPSEEDTEATEVIGRTGVTEATDFPRIIGVTEREVTVILAVPLPRDLGLTDTPPLGEVSDLQLQIHFEITSRMSEIFIQTASLGVSGIHISLQE